MGRPRKTDRSEKRTERFCVALKPSTVDLIYRYASLQGEQASPLVRRVLENVFGMLATPSSSGVCYGERKPPSPSTMSYVLTGARLGGADSPPLDRAE